MVAVIVSSLNMNVFGLSAYSYFLKRQSWFHLEILTAGWVQSVKTRLWFQDQTGQWVSEVFLDGDLVVNMTSIGYQRKNHTNFAMVPSKVTVIFLPPFGNVVAKN